MNAPVWTLGDRLRKARETVELTQQELADLVGTSKKTIARYEANAGGNRVDLLTRWAQETAVDLGWILGLEQPVNQRYLHVDNQLDLFAAVA
jgi:transcriptional regulator with XRE-family HTH domain